MPLDPRAARRMVTLVAGICQTEQADVIEAAEAALIGFFNGAVALRHLRMNSSFAAEVVRDAVLHKQSMPPEKA